MDTDIEILVLNLQIASYNATDKQKRKNLLTYDIPFLLEIKKKVYKAPN